MTASGMSADLVEVDVPRVRRPPDVIVEAPDGSCELWVPEHQRGEPWSAIVRHAEDDEPHEVAWLRGFPSCYCCATCGTASTSRSCCEHVCAATRAADLAVAHQTKEA